MHFTHTYLLIGQWAFPFTEVVSSFVHIIVHLYRYLQLFAIMKCESMMMGYAGGAGVEILSFIEVRRLKRLARFGIGRTLADAPATATGPVPGLQDRTAIS